MYRRFHFTPLFRSLLLRFLAIVLPLIILFSTFNFFVVAHREQSALRQQAQQRALSIARNLALNGAHSRESNGDYLLQPLAKAAGSLPDVRWVAFSDERGRLLATQGTVSDEVRPQMRACLQAASEQVRTLRQEGQQFVSVSVPMLSRAGLLGAVTLGISLETVEQASLTARRDIVGLTVLLLGAAVLVTFPLIYWLVAPVREVAQTARALARGDLSARVPHITRDELGRLGTALNGMADRLNELVEREKSKRESLQQRVSHLHLLGQNVGEGLLHVRAPLADDEIGQLAAGFNSMVEHLQEYLERERAMQQDLQANQEVLQAANARLVELDRLKSDFLNTVSHELRTPLTSIKAFSEILLTAAEDTDASDDRAVQAEFLTIIDQEADRLTRLIEDLLDLSRIEAGQIPWNMVLLPVDVVIDTCLRSCRALADQKKVRLDTDSEAGLTVRGDRDRLLQVVTNLVSNAIKFTPSGGSVLIVARCEGNGVEVAVSDTGVGIPEEFHGRIFERFQQVDFPDVHTAGSGLGLPIVKTIVEAHGGRVSLESEPGHGSTFIVWLPES